jgi:cation transport protein ChaC
MLATMRRAARNGVQSGAEFSECGVTGPFAPLSAETRQHSLTQALAGKPDEIWIFAYGSLMWDNAFSVAERRQATLRGYRRSFCVWTALARGTPDNPGLGLGLLRDAAAVCRGVALRIAPAARQSGLEVLWMREMWTGIYEPLWVTLETESGQIPALAFVVDTAHPQYAAGLGTARQAQRIAAARGKLGACREYFDSTLNALRDLGFSAEEFTELREAVERVASC